MCNTLLSHPFSIVTLWHFNKGQNLNKRIHDPNTQLENNNKKLFYFLLTI